MSLAAELVVRFFCVGEALSIPLLRGTAVQYIAASVALTPLALTLETLEIHWNGEFLFSLIWLVVVLSLGAVCLLMYLIARTGVAQVTSLFYLVPPAELEALFQIHRLIREVENDVESSPQVEPEFGHLS